MWCFELFGTIDIVDRYSVTFFNVVQISLFLLLLLLFQTPWPQIFFSSWWWISKTIKIKISNFNLHLFNFIHLIITLILFLLFNPSLLHAEDITAGLVEYGTKTTGMLIIAMMPEFPVPTKVATISTKI